MEKPILGNEIWVPCITQQSFKRNGTESGVHHFQSKIEVMIGTVHNEGMNAISLFGMIFVDTIHDSEFIVAPSVPSWGLPEKKHLHFFTGDRFFGKKSWCFILLETNVICT